MNQGMIAGGWDYVYAAYGITWTVLLIYGASLLHRGAQKERS